MARTDPLLRRATTRRAQALEQSLLTLERAQLKAEFEYARARAGRGARLPPTSSWSTDSSSEVLELQRRRLELDRAVADTSLLAKRRIRPTQDRPTQEVTHGD